MSKLVGAPAGEIVPGSLLVKLDEGTAAKIINGEFSQISGELLDSSNLVCKLHGASLCRKNKLQVSDDILCGGSLRNEYVYLDNTQQ